MQNIAARPSTQSYSQAHSADQINVTSRDACQEAVGS